MADAHAGSTATSGDEPVTEERPEPTSTPPPAPAPRWGGGRRALLGNPRVAWVVALLAIAVAVFFFLQAQGDRQEAREQGAVAADLQARERARAEALEAGEIAALQLTTFTGKGIDQWVEQTRKLAVGKFAQDLSKQYDQQLRADLRRFRVQSVGEMINSFVQGMEGDKAVVFTVLRQTTRYPTFKQTVEDEVRFEITVQRARGRWMVSDAKLLSPTPALRPRPFLNEQPADG